MSIKSDLEVIGRKVDINTDAFWDYIVKHTTIESWCEGDKFDELFEPGEEVLLAVYFDEPTNILFYRKLNKEV